MAKLNYEVMISGADNGLIVQLGCKRLVFMDKDIADFLADLSIYLTQGYAGEREMYKKYFGESPEEQCVRDAPPLVDANYGRVGNARAGGDR